MQGAVWIFKIINNKREDGVQESMPSNEVKGRLKKKEKLRDRWKGLTAMTMVSTSSAWEPEWI